MNRNIIEKCLTQIFSLELKKAKEKIHVSTAKQIISFLEQEIKWHEENRDKTDKSDDWKDGFIESLKHVKRFIEEHNE